MRNVCLVSTFVGYILIIEGTWANQQNQVGLYDLADLAEELHHEPELFSSAEHVRWARWMDVV